MSDDRAFPYDHIVLVSLDTLRSDCIGANPDKLWPDQHGCSFTPRTPLLDEVVGRSTFFPNAISAAPYTSASHASYFTGRWPPRHGVWDFFNRRLEAPTVFTRGRAAGFRTIYKVDFPIILGAYLGFNKDADDYLIEDDDAFLRSLAAAKRSVSFVHFGGLHVPYGFHNLHYGGDEYRRTVAMMERNAPPEAKPLASELHRQFHGPEDLELLMRYKLVLEAHYRAGDYDSLFELYLRGVDFFFRSRFEPFFHRLMAILEGTRHLVVMFADHGEEYDVDSYGHFNTLAMGVIRVPVIFHGTDIPSAVHEPRIRTIDIAPTLMDLAGFPARSKEGMDGVSLADSVRSGAPYPERTAIAQAYTSATADFLKHQKTMIAGGDRPGPLRHVRYKETIFSGDFRLYRQNFRNAPQGGLEPCPPILELSRRGSDRRYRAFKDLDVRARLLRELDEYNAQMDPEAPSLKVPEDIRQQLHHMGYKV